MQINECSYCGMLAITENGICYNCQKALGQTDFVQQPNPEHTFESSPATTISETSFESFEHENYADNFQTQFNDETQPPHGEQIWGKCPVCNVSISRNGAVCQRCLSRESFKIESKDGGKSLSGKITAIFVLLIVAASVGFYYFYYVDSAYYVNRKFEKATGLTSNIVFDSVEVTGTAQMGLWDGGAWEMAGAQDLSFQLNFQKPGKSLIDFRQIISENGSTIEKSLFKQGFDGKTGWKLTQPPDNQPAKLEDTDNGFGGDFLSGGDDTVSYSVLDIKEREKNSKNLVKFFEENVKTFKVNEVEKQSAAKNYLLVTKKSSGDSKIILLVFDKDSGFLLGISQRELVNGLPFDVLVSFDEYQRFSVEETGFFGKSKKSVLIPTALKYRIGNTEDDLGNIYNNYTRQGKPPVLVIDLKLKNFTTDKVISDALFEKPVLPNLPVANRDF